MRDLLVAQPSARQHTKLRWLAPRTRSPLGDGWARVSRPVPGPAGSRLDWLAVPLNFAADSSSSTIRLHWSFPGLLVRKLAYPVLGASGPTTDRGMLFFARGRWIPTRPLLGVSASLGASDDTSVTQYTQFIKLRWPTLATLALCTLLPGCPLTDNYFTQSSYAGSGPVAPSAGSSGLSAAGASATAGLDAGSYASYCGDPSGGSSTDAGSPSSDAGSTATEAGSTSGGAGGSGAGGTGGNGGSLTTAGTAAGGAAEIAGSPNLPDPACKDGVVKGSACTPASAQFCYKSCGPDNVGYKSETCQNGAYVEQSVPACTFPPAQDYACYKLPVSLPEACPLGVPRGGRPCQIAGCTVCFGGSVLAPQYQDSTGAQKPGFCVCADSGVWTCASTTSWPCPDGQGCQ